MMKKKTLMSILAAIIFGLFPVVDVVRAEDSAASERLSMMESSQTQSRRFGPYATVDRANQVVLDHLPAARAFIYSGEHTWIGRRVNHPIGRPKCIKIGCASNVEVS